MATQSRGRWIPSIAAALVAELTFASARAADAGGERAAPAGTAAPGPRTTSPQTTSETALVDVQGRIPDLVPDLRYATPNNFLKRTVYPPTARCLLLPDTVSRLEKAAAALRAQGYRLRVYDCYRPRAVQWEMWKLYPHPGYVADPRFGSNHNRGAAVDLTLATQDGKEVEMPTPFDSFEAAAHQGFAGASVAATAHREVLRAAMHAAGFKENRMEWWHYDLPDARRFAVLDVPFAEVPTPH